MLSSSLDVAVEGLVSALDETRLTVSGAAVTELSRFGGIAAVVSREREKASSADSRAWVVSVNRWESLDSRPSRG